MTSQASYNERIKSNIVNLIGFLSANKKKILYIIILNIIVFLGLIYYEKQSYTPTESLYKKALANYSIILFSQLLIFPILSLYDNWKKHLLKISEKHRMQTLENLENYYKNIQNNENRQYKINIYKEKTNILEKKTVWSPKTKSSKNLSLFIPGYALGYGIFKLIKNDPDKVVLVPSIPKHTPQWLYMLKMLLEPYDADFRKMLLNSGWNQLKYRPQGININKVNSEYSIEFLVEPVSYYYSFFTEQGVDYKLYPDKNITLRDILSPYLYSTITRENSLIREILLARDNPIANTLGVEILLIARDGTILIKRRSKTVAVEKEKLDPGISGGLDWNSLMYYYQQNNHEPVKLSDAIKHELAEKRSSHLRVLKTCVYT